MALPSATTFLLHFSHDPEFLTARPFYDFFMAHIAMHLPIWNANRIITLHTTLSLTQYLSFLYLTGRTGI
jgi:hypothetical protein